MNFLTYYRRYIESTQNWCEIFEYEIDQNVRLKCINVYLQSFFGQNWINKEVVIFIVAL